jgi:hypothetical protein
MNIDILTKKAVAWELFGFGVKDSHKKAIAKGTSSKKDKWLKFSQAKEESVEEVARDVKKIAMVVARKANSDSNFKKAIDDDLSKERGYGKTHVDDFHARSKPNWSIQPKVIDEKKFGSDGVLITLQVGDDLVQEIRESVAHLLQKALTEAFRQKYSRWVDAGFLGAHVAHNGEGGIIDIAVGLVSH